MFENLMPRTAIFGLFENHYSSPEEQQRAEYIAAYNKQHQELVDGSRQYMMKKEIMIYFLKINMSMSVLHNGMSNFITI